MSARTAKYMYKSSGGHGGDLSIEYGTDIGGLTRLEVKTFSKTINARITIVFQFKLKNRLI